jgi:ubiquinone/menaquinone biosynthesis C-methylase UbiE
MHSTPLTEWIYGRRGGFRVSQQGGTSEFKILSLTNNSTAGTGFLGDKADEYARAYEEETPGGFALRIRQRRVLELFDQAGGKVLDVGCGPAEMVQPLLSLGCEFWGVDPSPRMIEICRKRSGETRGVHFAVGEASRLSFPAEFFDAVLCMGVIDGLKNINEVLEEMVRVLKPGGTIIITFANKHSPYAWWKAQVFYRILTMARRIAHPGTNNDPILTRRRLFSPREASELLCNAGTHVEQTLGYFCSILFSPLDEIWPKGALWLNQRLEEAQGGKPDWLAAGFILKARKAEKGGKSVSASRSSEIKS